jgi:hypothetical protein
MLTLGQTLQAVDEILKTIETAACGWKNDDAISAITKQTRTLRWGRSDPYILEKVGYVETYTPILYSPRKAEKHGGSDGVKRIIFGACQNISGQARRLNDEALESGKLKH